MFIKTLNNSIFSYTYQPNRDYNNIEDRFLKNTLTALDFLVKSNALTIQFKEDNTTITVDVIDVLVADKTNNITIVPAQKNAYNPNTNTVYFYDTHGVVFRKNHKKSWFKRNKGFNSPVALLSHELIHCYNEIYDTKDNLHQKKDYSSRGKKIDNDGRDLSFPNAEEVFVIKMTNQFAARLGEDRRSNYGRSYYPTQNVLTTEKAIIIKSL